jgi:hypothetical protein
MPEDIRKTHVLTTIANYFGFDYDAVASLSDHRALGSFLDDANCPLLSSARGHKHSVHLSNEVIYQILSFYSLYFYSNRSK